MTNVDDDRDEAYYSGLYSLQGETDSREMSKNTVKNVRRSPSPRVVSEVARPRKVPGMAKQTIGGMKNLKLPPESALKVSRSNNPGLNPETPMSYLAGRLTGVDLRNEQCDSPSREFDSGVFPSMSESAYGSMQQPSSLSNEKESLVDSSETKDTEKMDVEDDSGVISMSITSKLVEEDQSNIVSSSSKTSESSPSSASLMLPSSRTRTRSESPIVPPVGESVEVMTDVPLIVQSSSGGSKRAIESEEGELLWHHKKTPRLSDVEDSSGMSKKPIRVKTIVSPAGSPRPRKRVVSPHRSPRDSHSPVSISVTDEKSMDTSVAKQPSPSPGSVSPISTQQQPVVNFRDIGDLAKSSNPDQGIVYVTVHPASLAAGGHTPILLGVSDLARKGPVVSTDSSVRIISKGGMLLEPSRSPKRGNSPVPPASTAAVFKLLTAGQSLPRSSSPNRLSPALSPLGASAVKSPSTDKKEDKSEKKDDKDGKPGAGNALLQVTEAHLATLSDEDGDTPLHLAIIHENVGLTQYLVKLIVGVYMNLDIANNMRQTPLHLAVITRQPQMVQLLVGAGASVNFPDRKGNTALHLAAARRDVRILQLLAQATNPLPDYNAKNFTGLTAIHVATKEASIDVLKFFFQMGANKNAPDACSGRTALHYAVESENFTLVNFLLENNVNVNAATFSGNTPLHVAAGRRLKEIVALLMAYGANPAIANGEGDFPSDLPASLLMQRAKMHNAH